MSRESSFNVVGYKSENESEKGDETPRSLEDPALFTHMIKGRSSKLSSS